MIGRTMERRVSAVEKRLGVTGRPLEQSSDLDLLTAIEMVSGVLAAEGDANAAETLAQHDAEEAKLQAFWAQPNMVRNENLDVEPGVRWPHLRARARWHENAHGQHRPRSAGTDAELWQKIVASGCLEAAP